MTISLINTYKNRQKLAKIKFFKMKKIFMNTLNISYWIAEEFAVKTIHPVCHSMNLVATGVKSHQNPTFDEK